MENYIFINNQKISLTAEQVAAMTQSTDKGQVELGSKAVGDTVKIGDYEFIVLKHTSAGTHILLKNLFRESEKFGENNNFDGSNVLEICDDFAQIIAGIVGEDNIIEHTVDLTSDDGLKDYGTVNCNASLLTTNDYREYVSILDKHKLEKCWWLATPDTTPTHANANWVKCVSLSGDVYDDFYYGSDGVRPFLILKSNIVVSK